MKCKHKQTTTINNYNLFINEQHADFSILSSVAGDINIRVRKSFMELIFRRAS